jgi:hypothetical protein
MVSAHLPNLWAAGVFTTAVPGGSPSPAGTTPTSADPAFSWLSTLSGQDSDQVATYSPAYLAGQASAFGQVGGVAPSWPIGNTGANGVALTGAPFQAGPPRDACDPRVPQSAHSGVMLCALGDGSVRTVTASVSPMTFYAAVTPAGGEVPGTDW